MIQESSLRLGIDSTDMERGARDGEAALDRIGRRSVEVETQFEKLQRRLGGMRALFASLGAALAVREFARLLDTATEVDNRLRLVTNTTAELNAVYGELLAISNRTRSSLQTNADVFNSLAIATKDLGLTYRQQLDLSEQLNLALAISGTSALAASGALRQLGQGLAAGALRGDEFISVSENIPVLLDLIAEELTRVGGGARVTRGQLRALAGEGKLTAELIVDALGNASEELEERFAKVTPTIASAFNVLQNNALDFTRSLNNATGVGEIFARAILLVADNFDLLAGAAAAVAIVVGGVLVKAFAALTIALAANPIGLVVVAIGALIAALSVFGDEAIEVGGQTTTTWNLIKAVFITVGETLSDVASAFVDFYNGVISLGSGWVGAASEQGTAFGSRLIEALQIVVSFYRTGFNALIATAVTAVAVIVEGWSTLPASFKLILQSTANVVLQGVQFIVSTFASGIGAIGDLLSNIPGVGNLGDAIRSSLDFDLTGLKFDTSELEGELQASGERVRAIAREAFSTDFFAEVASSLESLGDEAFKRLSANITEVNENAELSANLAEILAGRFGDAATAVNSTSDAAGKALPTFRELIAELQIENALLTFNTRERERLSEILTFEDELKRTLTGAERDLVIAAVANNQALTLQAQILEDLQGPQEALAERIAVTTALFEAGKISTEQFSLAMRDAALAQAEFRISSGEGSFADGFLVELERMTEGVNSFSSAAGSTLAGFVGDFGSQFSQVIGDAIFDTDSLGESLKRVARNAISNLISSLIQLGLQFVANQVLSAALGTASVALASGQAAALASAWAPAASFASLASFGANAIPASAALISTTALAETLAAVGGAFKDGGFVSGPGGPRDDMIPAALSNGEFVVNAAATRGNRPLLEAINSGRGFTGGGLVVNYNVSTPDADSFNETRSQRAAQMEAANMRARMRGDA